MGGGYFGSIYFGQYSPETAPAIVPVARIPFSAVGLLAAEIYSPAGALQGTAPIRLIDAENETGVNIIGSFRLRCPATDPNADEFTVGREVRVFREGDGELWRGLVGQTRYTDSETGPVLEVTGPSLAAELERALTYTGVVANDVTPAAAMTSLLAVNAAPAWTRLVTGAGYLNITHPFPRMSLFRAFRLISEIEGAYIRTTNTAREIELKNTSADSGLRLENIEHVSPDIDDNASLGLISGITVRDEGDLIVNRVVPYGESTGGLLFDLALSTRSSPYTIQSFIPRAPSIANAAEFDITTGKFKYTTEFNSLGENRLTLILVTDKTPHDIVDFARVNGKSGTRFLAEAGPAGAISATAFYVTAPAKGVVKVDLEWDADTGTTGPSAACRAFVIGLKDCEQSSPIRNSATFALGTSTAPTTTISSAVDDLVIDILAHVDASAAVGAGQSVILQNAADDARSSQEPGAASVTMSWTLGSSVGWIIAALSIKPRTVYYLEDSASVTARGRRAKEAVFRDAKFNGGTSAELIAAENTLYDMTAAYLVRNIAPIRYYEIKAEKLSRAWLPGDTMAVAYRGWAEDEDGKRLWIDVNANLIALKRTESINADGVRSWSILFAPVVRYPQTLAEIIHGQIVSLNDLESI